MVLIEVKGGTGWSYDATKDNWTINTANGPKNAPGPYNQISRNAAGLEAEYNLSLNQWVLKILDPQSINL